MIAVETSEKNFKVKMELNTFGPTDIIKARTIFSQLQRDGILIGDYEDSKWVINDELHTRRLIFDVNTEKYQQTLYKQTHMPIKEYVLYSKTYTLYLCGSMALRSIGNVARVLAKIPDIMLEVSSNDYSTVDRYRNGIIERCLDFLETLFVSNNWIHDNCKMIRNHLEIGLLESAQRRALKEFINYYRFDKWLNQFWEEASYQEKLHFFPIYFWWKVTTIIPTRVEEMIVTPRKCISENNGRTFLTLRKTKAKKGRGDYAYKISKDYEEYFFPIPHDIASQIVWYIDKSNNLKRPDNGTLFHGDSNVSSWKHLNAQAFGQLLKRFYIVLEKRYDVRIIDKSDVDTEYMQGNLEDCEERLSEKQDIEMILPGDTRHIAMINAALSTNSLYICKVLAGHEDIGMASWYAGNIEQFVESYVFKEMNKHTVASNEQISGKVNLFNAVGLSEQAVHLGNNKYCVSGKFAANDYDDCLATSGDCGRCRYQRIKGATTNEETKRQIQRKLEADVEYLKWAMEQYRKNMGCDEELASALNRIKHCTHEYSSILVESFDKHQNMMEE